MYKLGLGRQRNQKSNCQHPLDHRKREFQKNIYFCFTDYVKACHSFCVSESESEVLQLCPTLCDPMDCSPPGSSVHGIFQARVLEYGAISFSRGSSQPRDQTRVSHTAGRCFTMWITTNCGKFLKRWEYQTTLPASWETYMQVKKQHWMESNMESYITICKIDSQREFAVWLRELKLGLCNNLEEWDGEGGDVCIPMVD